MNDDDLTYKILRILERADQSAINRPRINGNNTADSPGASQNRVNHQLCRNASSLRSIYFGMAMMIVAIIMIQIGSAINSEAFRWAFYLGASGYLISGVIVFDRGIKRLPSQPYK